MSVVLFSLDKQESTGIKVSGVESGIVRVSVALGVEPHIGIAMVLVDSVVNPHHAPNTSSFELLFSITISARLPWCSSLFSGLFEVLSFALDALDPL